MKFDDLKIAYWPYSAGGKGPGDRRRFVFYAKEKGIDYCLATPDETNDIVYLTAGCDIYKWIEYKRKNPAVKMIFEMVDSYFLERFNIFTATRGIVKFLTGKETKIHLDYRKAIKEIVQAADAIVCSTPVQREFLLKYNSNVHVSLDFFEDDIVNKKTNYSTGKKLKLVWEGQAYTVYTLLCIKDVLKTLSDKIELHIITDPIVKFPFKIFNKKTAKVVEALECEYYLHTWEKDTFSKIIADADMAIIPLNSKKHGDIVINKPENKLLLFWQIGIPVITSLSPAYKRVMDKAGLPFYCTTENEWLQKITDFYYSTAEDKKSQMTKAAEYLDQYHSREKIVGNWDKIFLSINLPVDVT